MLLILFLIAGFISSRVVLRTLTVNTEDQCSNSHVVVSTSGHLCWHNVVGFTQMLTTYLGLTTSSELILVK